jgi:hypothetical protein
MNRVQSNNRLYWPCLLFFVIGATLRIDIYIIGRFALGEIIAILILPIALGAFPKLMRVRSLKYLVYALALWAIGVVVSDIVNHSYFSLFLRGLARPIICFVLLVVVYFLGTKNPRSFLYFFYGLLLSGALNAIVPTDFRAEDIEVQTLSNYKYAAFALTPLVFGVASLGAYWIYRISPLLAGGFQIAIGIFCIPYFSRTTAATILCGGLAIIIFSLLPFLRRYFISNGRLRAGAVMKALLFIIVSFVGVYYIYAYAASSGMMGERQYLKFVSQSNSIFGNTPWGVLMSGRHYTLAAVLRIFDHAILGAGSWPYAGDYIVNALNMLGEYNIPASQMNPFVRDLGHSIIFGIWAQNGILVVPFMVYSLFITVKASIHILTLKTSIKALVLIYLISFIFGFFFNNFNSMARFLLVYIPVFYVMYIQSGYLQEETSLLSQTGQAGSQNRR